MAAPAGREASSSIGQPAATWRARLSDSRDGLVGLRHDLLPGDADDPVAVGLQAGLLAASSCGRAGVSCHWAPSASIVSCCRASGSPAGWGCRRGSDRLGPRVAKVAGEDEVEDRVLELGLRWGRSPRRGFRRGRARLGVAMSSSSVTRFSAQRFADGSAEWGRTAASRRGRSSARAGVVTGMASKRMTLGRGGCDGRRCRGASVPRVGDRDVDRTVGVVSATSRQRPRRSNGSRAPCARPSPRRGTARAS